MATVRMKKGSLYADIFDSPETIKQAQFDGFSIVETEKKEEPKPVAEKTSEETQPKENNKEINVRAKRQ